MIRIVFPTLVLVLLASPACAQAPATVPAQAGEAAATITAEDFHRRIGVMAHDTMRGRATPSPELDATAAWIAAELEGMGLEPAPGMDGFVQRYPILTLAVDLESSWIRSGDGADVGYGRDALPVLTGAPSAVRVSGPVVVVSGTPEEEGALPVERLAGAHVVLVPAAGVGANLFRDRATLGLVRDVAAARPASILLAADEAQEAWAGQVAQVARRTFSLIGEPATDGIPVTRVRDDVLRSLLDPRGVELASLRAGAGGPMRVQAVDGLTLELNQAVREVERTSAPNVVAVLPGSDPGLADEFVVFSAHMDHVGVGRPDESGDSIYNGADDDASGTVAVMEVAEAMASLPTAPRRSTLFLLVSGEERGLWGSRYFAENPPVPTEAMVAALNADMVGRNWPDTIVAIGRQHSDLGETLARVNAAHPELGMEAIDDRWPEQNFYRRSDHFNFARRGVPILFFFNGTHDDYHRPSDEIEAIDTDKAARIARLVYWLGLEVANAEEPPRWNPDSYREIVEGGGGG